MRAQNKTHLILPLVLPVAPHTKTVIGPTYGYWLVTIFRSVCHYSISVILILIMLRRILL